MFILWSQNKTVSMFTVNLHGKRLNKGHMYIPLSTFTQFQFVQYSLKNGSDNVFIGAQITNTQSFQIFRSKKRRLAAFWFTNLALSLQPSSEKQQIIIYFQDIINGQFLPQKILLSFHAVKNYQTILVNCNCKQDVCMMVPKKRLN